MTMHGARWLRSLVAPLALATTLVAFAPAGQGWERSRDGLPLWEVSGGGNTIHLLGSIHVLRQDAYPLDPAIYEVFDAAQTVVFEVDLAELVQGSAEMMTRGMLPEGRTLADVLPSDLYAELERRASGMPVPFEAIQSMKPWLVSLMLSTVALQQAGFYDVQGVDGHLYERAIGAGKRTMGLETVGDQIDVFDGLSEVAQIEMLRQTVRDLDSAAVQLDRIVGYWRRGDVESVAADQTKSMRGHPEMLERLLFARNRRWVPRIEHLLRSGESVLVVVGMGHLVGEGSVIEMLRERGYTVTRVSQAVAVGT